MEMNESRSKIHGLALDLVDEGKDLSLWEEKVRKKKHPLPEGGCRQNDVFGTSSGLHGRLWWNFF